MAGRKQSRVPSARPLQVYKLFRQIVDGIVVNKERALAEVRADYSTTTEIADALLQRADVPFRIGHHFASEMTTYGRAKGKRPTELTYPELQAIYKEATHGQTLPLSETQMKQALDPKYVVSHRSGLGGSQPAEVTRMLGDQKAQLAARTAWLVGAGDYGTVAAIVLNGLTFWSGVWAAVVLLAALMVTLLVPVDVAVPLIRPVAVFTLSPAGNPLAP